MLFVVSDDLCPRLGCYGDPLAKSPYISRGYVPHAIGVLRRFSKRDTTFTKPEIKDSRMIQSDEVVAKLLTETPLRLRVAPPIESSGRISIVGGMLICVVCLLLQGLGANPPHVHSEVVGVTFAALWSLWWLMSAGWQLQIDSHGIRRTRLWLWEDVWSWDDFRSGRVKPSTSEPSIFRDDQRPVFRRSLSFVLLGIEDLTRLTRACLALCRAAETGPTQETRERIKVVTLNSQVRELEGWQADLECERNDAGLHSSVE